VEPHICEVVNRTSDPRGEYVQVANSGPGTVAVNGLELSDYTATQQHAHIYRFPDAEGGGDLTLKPGQSAYVFTGKGNSVRNEEGHLILFAGRSAPIWNNDGDVAYLRRLDGTFVDSRTVGDPKRHPNGH
jgi:Lamin Tail Domain